MENKDLLSKIKENKELSTELEKLWKEDANTEQFGETMTKYGVEATNEQAEQLLKELQTIKAKEISSQKIDENQLEKVAGGFCFLGMSYAGCYQDYAQCDNRFKSEAYKNAEICFNHNLCDQVSNSTKCVSPM